MGANDRDHVFPSSRFRVTPGEANIVNVCVSCNRDKADMTIPEWIASMESRPDKKSRRRVERLRQFWEDFWLRNPTVEIVAKRQIETIVSENSPTASGEG